MRGRPTVTYRVTLLIGGLVILTLGGFALGFYVMLQRQLLSTVDQQLADRAALMEQVLGGEARRQVSLQDLIPPLVELTTPGLYVVVMDAADQVQWASADLPAGYLPVEATLLADARAGQTRLTTITVGDDAQLRMLVTSLTASRPPGTVIVVAESLEPIQRLEAKTRTLMLGCGLVALATTLGGTIMVTRRLVAPIQQVTTLAQEVTQTQQYTRRVPLPARQDELGRLIATINALIETVETTLAQQRQLLADTSHELRSPLTAILANLALLRRDLDPTERDLSVTEAMAEAQRMRRLVTDLLLLSQPTSTQVLDVHTVDLAEILTLIVASVRRHWPTAAITWAPPAACDIRGDPERLTQLLRNVVENAVHHTPPGTPIAVCLSSEVGWAVVRVTDAGPGIAAEHLPAIWQRFYRVDKARSRQHGGTGLGLAIVHYLVTAHGGTVEVTSARGVGTTFRIHLPRPPADDGDAARP
jgi:two-component system, OmpR family, sensor kinase